MRVIEPALQGRLAARLRDATIQVIGRQADIAGNSVCACGNNVNTLLLSALAVPGMAMAEDGGGTQHKEGIHVIPASAHTVTSNVSLTSNYLYRGISQTGGKPALQGGFDYAHASGFYAGAWGSSISWISDLGLASSAGLELDTYLGFKNGFAEDFSYDVGYLRYNYPGTYVSPLPLGFAKANTDEIYGAIGWKWLTLKYSRALGDTFAVDNAGGSNYVELNASYSLADSGITLGAHYGKQTYKAEQSLTALGYTTDAATYSDYKLSASKDFSGYVVGLAVSSTNVKKDGPGLNYYTAVKPDGSAYNLGKGTAILSVSHAM